MSMSNQQEGNHPKESVSLFAGVTLDSCKVKSPAYVNEQGGEDS